MHWSGNKGGVLRCAVAMGGEEDDGWASEAVDDGDEGGVCAQHSGLRDEQSCYVTAAFGFLMNLSLPANWLLSCYCWQEKRSTNTNFICREEISQTVSLAGRSAHTQDFHFRGRSVRAPFKLWLRGAAPFHILFSFTCP